MQDIAYNLQNAEQSFQFQDCLLKCGIGGHPLSPRKQ